jgi:hypothetical protein
MGCKMFFKTNNPNTLFAGVEKTAALTITTVRSVSAITVTNQMSVCVAEWVRSHTVMLHCTRVRRISDSDPGNGHGQPNRPSIRGQLIGSSKYIQWVTTFEYCEV